MDYAEHTLFVCARWGVTREAVGRAMSAQLTPDTMVSFMLQSEQKWMIIESFITRGPASRADLAVRVVWGRNSFIPPMSGAASRFA